LKEHKIIFVINSTFPSYSGGIENWLFNILKEIPKQYNMRILSIKSNIQPFYEIPTSSKITFKYITSLRSMSYYSFLNRISFHLIMILEQLYWIFIATWKLVRDDSEIIISLHSIPTLIPCIIATYFKKNKKIVCSVRGVIGDDLESMSNKFLSKIYMMIEKYYLMRTDKVLANGWDTQKYLLKMGIESTVSPNGVDYHKFSNKQSSTTGNKQINSLIKKQKINTKIIVHVATLRGKINGIKDVIYLASVIKKESQILKEFIILFVGKGNAKPYKKYADNLGVLNQCIFLGEINYVKDIVKISDLVICLFGGGGTSQALIESMAVGKPIVAWDTLVYSQIIQNNIHGILVEKGNFSKMIKAIDSILSNKLLYDNLSENAQKKAETFDWVQVRQKLFNEINHV